VDELVIQAKRLGLTWGLRPGKVVSVTSGTGPYNPGVQLDGDDADTVILTASLVGGLAVGMRVMVMAVPPNGNYVVGIISSTDLRRYEVGGFTNHGTTITTTETVMETFSQFVIRQGAAYRVEFDGWLLAASTTSTQFRLRKTDATGTVLTASDVFAGIGLAQAPFRHVGYFVNNSGMQRQANLVVTAQTLSSTSTWGADTGRPRYASIQYAGPASEYPFAVPYV
jgi:hypothetical protein